METYEITMKYRITSNHNDRIAKDLEFLKMGKIPGITIEDISLRGV